MKKRLMQLIINDISLQGSNCVLMKLTSEELLPPMYPGQFAELKVEHSAQTYLRRPVSINYFDEKNNEVWFLIAIVGDGTRTLSNLKKGDTLDCILPLGNTFSIPSNKNSKILLVGGGVGVAPLLFFGKQLKAKNIDFEFLLGARNADFLFELSYFQEVGITHIATEDGSLGEKGFVTNHSILRENKFTNIATCGPKPMMMAVAKYAKANKIACEVSLENTMACGLGACLCCVENTTEGNICICKEGPVMNIDKLLWQI